MKKVSKTIAMLLVLVMLAGSFTGCLTYTRGLSLLTIVDIVFLPISLLALLIYVIINDASSEMDAQIYMANFEDNTMTEYYSLWQKIYSLPETELSSLEKSLNSIPEAARVSSMEKLNSLPEAKHISLVNAYNSLSEKEIVSSIKKLNSLNETELVSLLRVFSALSEAEFDSLIEELKSLRETKYIAAIDYSREKAYTGLSFQY